MAKVTVNIPEPVQPIITIEVSVTELADIVYWNGKGHGDQLLYSTLLKAWRKAAGRRGSTTPPEPEVK